MKVYRLGRPDQPGRHWLMLTPGATHPASDFMHADGSAILFNVEFVNGCAEVPDNLGRWMLDHGYAQDTLFILPPGFRRVERSAA